MTQTSPRLADTDARVRIREDTAASLFVTAGAGSGKTSALVERIVTLVLVDGLRLAHVAAVTFTEKAGAELRDRLRTRFEAAQRHAGDAAVADLARGALEDLDRAAIGTLHSFAQRILAEHAIAAGLPPLLEVQDEVASSVAFDERWVSTQVALLDDDDLADTLLLSLAAGVNLGHVRSLVRTLGADWDLLAERVLDGPDEPVTMPDLAGLTRQIDDVLDLRRHCTNEADNFLARFAPVLDARAALAAAVDDAGRLAAVKGLCGISTAHGQRGNWAVPLADVKTAVSELSDEAKRLADVLLDRCLRALTRWTARQVLDAAEARRRDGRLEFQDLLVLARDLLRRDVGARAALHEQYQRILLDEFQDTDPIQIEIAVRISGGADADATAWEEVVVPPGRLFVVGDAKQSIYKFRRASIATYLRAQQHVGEQVSLSTNFRTVGPVLDWVNTVFGELIQEERNQQPPYQALDAHRTEPAPVGPAVTVLGADAHEDLPRAAAQVLREREASDVAASVRQVLHEGWQVRDDQAGGWRPARLGDVAVLVPARTSLPELEDAFDSAGIAYRAEASSLVYEAQEVRDLLACARALADSTDELALVTALRSPLFGCGDDDLLRWRHAGGRFRLFGRAPDDEAVLSGPVGRALEDLRSLARRSRWSEPSEVLGAIVESRRMLEVAIDGARYRDTWRRLRFVVDQARAWSEVSHGGLRAYLAWVAAQSQDSARVAESVLPELDLDAVRIMTIHAAKGLEFPVVVMSGLTSQPRNPSGVQVLWPAGGGYAVRLTRTVQTGDFESVAPVEEQMDQAERRRLLYVAATRARDHLVVSLHRKAGSSTQTAAQLMADAGGATAGEPAQVAAVAPAARSVGDVRAKPEAPPDWDDWLAGIERARTASRAKPSVIASGLEGTEPEVVLAPEAEEPGLRKGPRDLELPPWSKGRYGSEVGRAVHGVLQGIDLTEGAGLDAAVEAQCTAEGVETHRELVAQLVRSALGSDLVRRAAVREHWREIYAGAPDDAGTLIEGYIDLVYRDDDDGLVLVDYKTDAIPAGALDSRVTYYRPQIRAYADTLQRATGCQVAAWLLFLSPAASTAREVTGA